MKGRIGTIHFIKGDATRPIGEGEKILVHICNDVGGWGKGFVLALSKRWHEPEAAYKNWYRSQVDFRLGNVQFVQVENKIIVANIIGQHHIVWKNDIPPIRYQAVKEGLDKVAKKALKINASIHMPRIGCGLAGGRWDKIEKIINETLVNKGLDVWVYDL